MRLIMVDPKQVEFMMYNGIPHLLIPVVTDPKKAAGALAWSVTEMENRYTMFSENNVRNIDGYNELAEQSDGELQHMPPLEARLSAISSARLVILLIFTPGAG